MRLFVLLFGILLSSTALAITSAKYLPEDADLDTSIPSPESVFGWEPGDWRVHHHELVRYLETLAEKSERVSIKVTGYTHEQRPLLQLIISSEENQPKIEALRQAHLQATRTGDQSTPLVVWLGYSVHGNEASGSNAVPIVAWYLAASRSEYVRELLENTIIILDPGQNPDGLDRFASWSNSNRSLNPVGDRNTRIHNEAWPQARTNHYLFDLNRDWLPLVHPESRARVTEFHRWLPHVLTDHHETRHEGYFFQPGAPSRQHPLTTRENLEMTRALSHYHARAFDQSGTMYFTEDVYDDFYYGKGSTYPDINGSIGILFEQPRVNGPVSNLNSGPLKFTDAIHNQVRTSLSTLKGAYELRKELISYQQNFFKSMAQRAEKAGFLAWIIGDGGDPARAQALMDVFAEHRIEYRALDENITASGANFAAGHAWVIPANQRQFGLVQAMLEKRTRFEDNTFYDVSAWSLPLAYNLPYTTLTRMPETTDASQASTGSQPNPDAVAWIIPWRQLDAPAVLQDLLEAGARVRAATRKFSARNQAGTHSFGEGSLVILAGIQDEDSSTGVFAALQLAASNGMDVYSFNSQLTDSGPGLGTPHFKPVPEIKPLLIAGEGVSSYAAGEAWHEMDQRLGVAPVMIEIHRLKNVRLHDYTHLLMVNGKYTAITSSLKKDIAGWVNDGGILVATERASRWAESLCFKNGECEEKEDEDKDITEPVEPIAYADFDDKNAQLTIGGAIVSAMLDTSHPVAYGYRDREISIFRRGTTLLKASENPFATPVRYTENPLVSGYIGAERLAEMADQPAVIAERHGKGLVVRFANNPLFRGFWRGTGRMWINSLYFGPLVDPTELPQ